MVAEYREERRSRSERGKIYEPGDVSQVLLSLSLSLSRLFLGRWLVEKRTAFAGPGGYQQKERGRELDFSYRAEAFSLVINHSADSPVFFFLPPLQLFLHSSNGGLKERNADTV